MISRSVRRPAAVCLAASALFALLASVPVRAQEALPPESNAALLSRALVASARRVIALAPLTPGSKVAIELGDPGAMTSEVERAVLLALTERRVEAVFVSKTGAAAAPSAAAPAPAEAPDSDASISLEQARVRQEQLAEEARRRATESTIGALPANGSGLAVPRLAVTIHEARVDYPRIYRSGLFGGAHVERRALSRISARLSHGEPPSVFWVSGADTAIGDSVPRADLRSLEDQSRPETRGTVPPEGWQKIAEPALVVGLVIGLVSLFYTNRP